MDWRYRHRDRSYGLPKISPLALHIAALPLTGHFLIRISALQRNINARRCLL